MPNAVTSPNGSAAGLRSNPATRRRVGEPSTTRAEPDCRTPRCPVRPVHAIRCPVPDPRSPGGAIVPPCPSRPTEELTGMRRAGRVVADALAAMRAAVVPGATPADIEAVGADILRRHGARAAPMVVYGAPCAAFISVNDVVVHGLPTRTQSARRRPREDRRHARTRWLHRRWRDHRRRRAVHVARATPGARGGRRAVGRTGPGAPRHPGPCARRDHRSPRSGAGILGHSRSDRTRRRPFHSRGTGGAQLRPGWPLAASHRRTGDCRRAARGGALGNGQGDRRPLVDRHARWWLDRTLRAHDRRHARGRGGADGAVARRHHACTESWQANSRRQVQVGCRVRRARAPRRPTW